MNRTTHTKRDDSGVVAIEFIVVVPFLLMLIVGIVVLGNALAIKTQTTGLARDGARAASLGLPLPADAVIVGGACPTPADATQFVTVQATKPVTVRSIPFLPAVLPANLTETVTMRCGG